MTIKENLKIRLKGRRESHLFYISNIIIMSVDFYSISLDLLFSDIEKFPIFIVPPLRRLCEQKGGKIMSQKKKKLEKSKST